MHFMAGVRIPAGSTMDAVYEGRGINAPRLRHHDLEDDEYVAFELPEGSSLDMAGSALRGDFVGVQVHAKVISAHVVKRSGSEYAVIRDGELDMATHTWRWKSFDD
jgi:hypothetical protein